MRWRPDKCNRYWLVRSDTDPRQEQTRYILGKDGTPIRFWSEASAQIRADAANRRNEQ